MAGDFVTQTGRSRGRLRRGGGTGRRCRRRPAAGGTHAAAWGGVAGVGGAGGVWKSGRSLRSAAAVPLQRGVRSEKARTASTKGSDGGDVSRASSIWRGVQFKAGAAAWAQARVAAWRVEIGRASCRERG